MPAALIEEKPGRRERKAAVDDDPMWPWWVSDNPRLTGNPKPFWESHHGGDCFHGDRLGRFMHKIDRPLFGWQWDTEQKILAIRDDGLFAHPDVVLIIPRQSGKTQVVIARILYGLFYLGEKIVYTAQRWKTVEDVYDRIVAIIASRPSLSKRLLKKPTKAGNHGEILLKNGASLNMGPRTAAVGRGQTVVDLAIFDEAYDIHDTHTTDLTGAQLASNNPQTIFVSTAAVQTLHPNCHVLAAMRRNAMRGEPDVYGAEWRAPDGMSRDDPEAWRLAQPSHGVTVRAREVRRELQRARTATLRLIFDADFLGWGDWPADEDDAEPVIAREAWDDLFNGAPALIGGICIGIDRTLDGKWWCMAAGSRTTDGRVHLEVGYWRRVNIGQMGAALLELIELWDPDAIVVDSKSPAAPIVNYMRKLGIEIEVLTTPKLAVYTRGFIDAIGSGDIGHAGQQIMADAVECAHTRELPRGDIVWDEVESGIAVTPLKAMTITHGAVLEYAEERGQTASPSTGDDIVDLDADTEYERGIMDAAF